MNIALPIECNPVFLAERLQLVASWLLEEYYSALDDLMRPTDSAWGRGCAAFDRQKNRIIREARSGKHPWLALSSGDSFAVVFTIGGVPCRFTNDSPDSPTKNAALLPNHLQTEFLEFVEDGEAGRFCFIVDRYVDGEAVVEFRGFTATGSLACRWVSDTPVRTLRIASSDAPLPPSIEVRKPAIGVKPILKPGEAANDNTGGMPPEGQ
jgi:hypothetical protein